MKMVFTFAILSILSISAFAEEQPSQIEPVTASELKLAGRGWVDKKTGETMAIACVGEPSGNTLSEKTCDRLRFVYFNQQKEKAYYIGSVHNVVDYAGGKEKAARLGEDRARMKAIKKLMKHFKRWRRDEQGMSEDSRQAITAISFMGVIGLEALAFLATSVSLATGLTAATYPLHLLVTPIITGDIKLMSGNQKATHAAYDANGWNWSSRPARIRSKVFDQLFHYLTLGEATPEAIRN